MIPQSSTSSTQSCPSTARPETFVVRVPAKVNLALHVGGLREDGFHPLETVFQAVSLWDEVTFTPIDHAVLEITMTGQGAEALPIDHTNLVHRAASLLADRYGPHPVGVRIDVVKDIPIAGGMAGGSADGAATLLGLNQFYGLGLSINELLEYAGELGSDMAFSLLGGTAIGVNRGEQLTPIEAPARFHWVFVMSTVGLSTPSVFREFDLNEPPRHIHLNPAMIQALKQGDIDGVVQHFRNDLQPVAFKLRPELAELYRQGLDAGALAAIVSGSGPTMAFLARDHTHAAALAERLSGLDSVAGVRLAYGPVRGAHLLG